MSRIAEGYKRWRHTRGYGVHSPFAYRIVSEAIRPARGYAYYGDSDIDHCFSSAFDARMRRHARILLRLICLLRPESVYLPQGIHPAFPTAVSCAGKNIRISRGLADAPNCDMICSTGSEVPLQTLCDFLSNSAGELRTIAIRSVPEGWADKLWDALGEGLLLRGNHGLIIVSRPRMQKISYKLRL